MPDIKIKVTDKVAIGDNTVIICNNSDYTVTFDLDSEWDSFTNRTMRVGYKDGTYTDVLFTGTTANLPTIIGKSIVKIGLYAGNIHTSTAATFLCENSATTDGGTPVTPTPSVYDQIIARLDTIDDEMDDKQDELTAGTGITIDANNVISATGTGSVTRESIVTALGSASPNLSANDYDATEKASVASSVSHVADSTIHVTSSDKSSWNGKQDAITSSTDLTVNSLSVGALKDKTGEHMLAEYIDSYEQWYLGDSGTPINATDASAFYVPATDASGASDQAATKLYVDNHHDSTKQDAISDLSTIRSGAALGDTSVQGVKVNGTELTKDADNKVNYVTEAYPYRHVTDIVWDADNITQKYYLALSSGCSHFAIIVELASAISGTCSPSFGFKFSDGSVASVGCYIYTTDGNCYAVFETCGDYVKASKSKIGSYMQVTSWTQKTQGISSKTKTHIYLNFYSCTAIPTGSVISIYEG